MIKRPVVTELVVTGLVVTGLARRGGGAPALVAAELNVRLPLTMVTFAGGPSAPGPVPVHPAMTSSPAAPAPTRPTV